MRVAVAGAGIGGLVAAIALDRLGATVTVFERASELRAVGAGLQLSPNALDVLQQLGVTERLRAVAVAAESVTLREGHSGRALAHVPVSSTDGRGYVSLLRADLQDALVAALGERTGIALRTGHPVESLASDARGLKLPGIDEPFDLVVAADGVRSAIRGTPPRESGSVAVRLRVAQSAEPGIEAWLGFRRHAVSYPVAAGGETNLVLIVPGRDAETAPRRLFRRWDRRLQDLIGRGAMLGTWPLLEQTPLWHAGRVAFVGDAAHAMLPYAAQGAAMAIEDGWVLATSLARTGDVAAGLAAYEAARAPRFARVLQRVRFHRLVYHLPRPVSFGRDAVLALTPPDRLRAQLSWLYDWRAPPLD